MIEILIGIYILENIYMLYKQYKRPLGIFSPVYIVAFMGDKYGDEDINQNGFEYNGIWSSVTFFVTNSLKAGLSIINAHGQGDKILTVFSTSSLLT